MKKNKTILLLVVLALAGTTVFFAFRIWRAGVVARQEQRAFHVAQQLVARGDFAGALTIIRQQPAAGTHQNWSGLEVRTLAGLRSAPLLAAIFQRAPGRVLADEEASLVLARAYASSRNVVLFSKIRDAWRLH